MNNIMLSEYGKLPPQAIEAEELVLGALMIEKDSIVQIREFLKTEMFYKDNHALIYKAICDLFDKNNPVDILTVTEKLRENGDLESVGGAYAVTMLTIKITSAANIEYHARIIQQHYIKRALIVLCSGIIKDSYDDTSDPFSLLNSLSSGVSNLYESSVKGSAKVFSESVVGFKEAVDSKRYIPPSERIEIRTDELLDKILFGLTTGLYIIAARPSMGKTAYMLQLARNIAKQNIPVLIYSLEMTGDELISRVIGGEAEISPKRMVNGDMTNSEWDRFYKESDNVKSLPLIIDDSSRMSIFEFKSKSHKYKLKHDVRVIMVDYLQLMDGDPVYKADTNKRMGTISRTMKEVSKELGVPVIALAQLNRATESTANQIPKLSNLRDSGEIEQDADVVGFVYRPYAAGIQEENGMSTFNDAKLIIAKHRGGELGVVDYYVSDDKTNWTKPKDQIEDFMAFPDINKTFEPKIKPNEDF